jgi:protein-disulfide isomerase
VAALAIIFFTGDVEVGSATIEQEYEGDIGQGAEDAKVVLVEYADFECAACAEYAQLLAPIRAEYQDRVRFVFRFFPLPNHRYGMISAQASFAALLQGKFWEMHDLLYANQQAWVPSEDPMPFLEAYATELGLNLDKFRADLEAESTKEFITSQHAEGEEAGVTHTPWFFINGKTIETRTADGFREAIEAEL